jgi:hypothetical protein
VLAFLLDIRILYIIYFTENHTGKTRIAHGLSSDYSVGKRVEKLFLESLETLYLMGLVTHSNMFSNAIPMPSSRLFCGKMKFSTRKNKKVNFFVLLLLQ